MLSCETVRKHIVLTQRGWAKEVNVPAISKTIKSADWRTEKHVPVIELPPAIKAGEDFQVKVSLGEGVPHPNTTEHHIRWIAVYFQPEGAPVPTEIGNFEFSAHGESASGPNEGPLYTAPSVVVTLRTDKPGLLQALSYCNIHGVWESTAEVSF
jgi:superoxide reductase